jgi:Uma2 family endonuclease
MSAMPKKKLFTYAEYLALEARSEQKHEYFDGEMFAMPGTTATHSCISSNLNRHIHERLDGTPCRVFDSNLKVRVVATGLVAYPDLTVVCGDPGFDGDKQLVLLNPKVIVEILSPSTETYDRTVKVRHYRQIESLGEIVLVAQDEPRIETYLRSPDGSWKHEFYSGLENPLEIVSLQLSIPLASIYDRVVFPEPEPLPVE